MRQNQINYQEVIYLRDVKKKSFAFIAGWLGCHYQTLMAGIKNNGIIFQVKRSPYAQERTGKADKTAQAMGFESIEQLIAHYRPSMRIVDIAKMTGLSHSTISEHTPENTKYVYLILTPEGIKNLKKNLEKAREVIRRKTNHNHFWRNTL